MKKLALIALLALPMAHAENVLSAFSEAGLNIDKPAQNATRHNQHNTDLYVIKGGKDALRNAVKNGDVLVKRYTSIGLNGDSEFSQMMGSVHFVCIQGHVYIEGKGDVFTHIENLRCE